MSSQVGVTDWMDDPVLASMLHIYTIYHADMQKDLLESDQGGSGMQPGRGYDNSLIILPFSVDINNRNIRRGRRVQTTHHTNEFF